LEWRACLEVISNKYNSIFFVVIHTQPPHGAVAPVEAKNYFSNPSIVSIMAVGKTQDLPPSFIAIIGDCCIGRSLRCLVQTIDMTSTPTMYCFVTLLLLPITVLADADQKSPLSTTQQQLLLRRRNTANLYNVAAPSPDPGIVNKEFMQENQEIYKSKEEKELWNRLLGDSTTSSMETKSNGGPWY
jgi:hypothetical protein